MPTRLLFDNNLSPRLPAAVRPTFPGSIHVREAGLDRATDREVWEFARAHAYAIVTKDDDFRQLAFLHGAPPKVIWVKLGNCATGAIINLLRQRQDSVATFLADDTASLLILRLPPSMTGSAQPLP